MNYQDAIERAITLRLLAKKETDISHKQVLLDLAREWEAWAEAAATGQPSAKSPAAPICSILLTPSAKSEQGTK